MLENLKKKTEGFKVYLISFLFCVPDLFDALGVVDLTPFIPAGYGTKVATAMAIVRITIGVTVRSMRNELRNDRDNKPDNQDRN